MHAYISRKLSKVLKHAYIYTKQKYLESRYSYQVNNMFYTKDHVNVIDPCFI